MKMDKSSLDSLIEGGYCLQGICEIFTVIALQDWVGWGIFTVIPGYPRRANGDSQHLETRPESQDWLRFELFTVNKIKDRALFEITRSQFRTLQ